MTTPTAPTALAPTTGAGVAAGLNPAQRHAYERLVKATAALADLDPLPDHYLAAEHAWQAWRRRNGD